MACYKILNRALLVASNEGGLEVKLDIFSCPVSRIHDKIIPQRLVRNTLKMWQSSNIWG